MSQGTDKTEEELFPLDSSNHFSYFQRSESLMGWFKNSQREIDASDPSIRLILQASKEDLGNYLGIVDAAEEDFEEARKTGEIPSSDSDLQTLGITQYRSRARANWQLRSNLAVWNLSRGL
ncbi:hypothetical protein PPACK8108_LOCUS23342 [Phakopsora pachyrhizi]|uniref:Uncharacterized protein n=1 Tax=Phakopsora pachyrhizi TaxID=170000 RepID=A0AAV0BNT3_PHAPC|nr:hypothetical protein PPACK8108_LOCUS23342 [Phakopsora pachyrhizi]